MTKNAQRQSQLVSTFGPGAMVDLPTRSVVIGGLELWEMRPGVFETVSEPRLAQRLERLLRDQGRLPADKCLGLRTPPVVDGMPGREPPGVISPTFPSWFVCERVESGPTPSDRRRRLVPWQDLDTKGRRKFAFDDGVKSEVTPIRFVCACENGHLQDISWRWVVHGATPCREPMWVQEKGTSADPADTSIACGCGARLSLQDLFTPGRLGRCVGERPWLLDRDPDGCDQNLKLLIRTATNTYFPQTLTVISLPAEEDELTSLVDQLSGDLANVRTVEHVAAAKQFNPKVSAALGAFGDADIFERLRRLREGVVVGNALPPKQAEFDVFASGRDEIGVNTSDAKLYARTLTRRDWDPSASTYAGVIRSLVAVHRLREVSCLYGFTRFEAAPTTTDGDIEDVRLAVRGAPISKDADWLPAVELFGEGLFLHFDETAIRGWLARPDVREREEQLRRGYMSWVARYPGGLPDYPGMAYVLLHSLSHALMQEIALDCGYPASSLKERVYALKSPSGSYDHCGILIYTASTGAQGTLGGLVGTAPRFAEILESAFSRVEICSNDPVCADHEPDGRSGDRATHGAACHGCLLIAETSCESRNQFLDRALLVRTMRGGDTAFVDSGI
jgi:Domain of unknown function (DUF1998)